MTLLAKPKDAITARLARDLLASATQEQRPPTRCSSVPLSRGVASFKERSCRNMSDDSAQKCQVFRESKPGKHGEREKTHVAENSCSGQTSSAINGGKVQEFRQAVQVEARKGAGA